MVLTALSGGKLNKLILKFNFLLISRALARFDAETFQRRVNCYIVTNFYWCQWKEGVAKLKSRKVNRASREKLSKNLYKN